MKERPILFSAPMVRALLAGTKTQTRRIVKPQPFSVALVASGNHLFDYRTDLNDYSRVVPMDKAVTLCPYGAPGDRLWVRETWAVSHALDHLKPREVPKGSGLVYYAATENLGGLLKRPSIFMPRWACRITLEVTGVRVERLQAISEGDAIAEGVEWNKCPTHQTQQSVDAQAMARRIGMAAHYEAEIDYPGGYRLLWESINGPASWDANPWVWVVEFKRVEA